MNILEKQQEKGEKSAGWLARLSTEKWGRITQPAN